MARALTAEERFDRYYQYARLLDSFVVGMHHCGLLDDPEMVNRLTGLIAESLHRVPKTPSGFISKNAVNLPYNKITPDHYYGRKVSGDLIFKMIMRGCSINRIAMIMWSRSRVHYVTSAENTKLIGVDSKRMFKSKLQIQREYAAAGIELVPYADRRKKVVYLIDGTVYTKQEACEKFNIKPATLYHRCNSKSKKGKYVTWQKIVNQ